MLCLLERSKKALFLGNKEKKYIYTRVPFQRYEKYFPIRKINIKPKWILSPWIRDGIAKSSERKQKLYKKLWKKTPHTYKRSQLRLYKATKNAYPRKNYIQKNLQNFNVIPKCNFNGKTKTNKSSLDSKITAGLI